MVAGVREDRKEPMTMTEPMNAERYVERVTEVHGGKYDYRDTIYVSLKKKIRVICPIHGPFIIRAADHLYGRGCPTCAFGGTVEERFWAKVDKDGPQVEYMDSPCWDWTGSIAKAGYGRFGVTHGNIELAHVFSYELAHGPIERDEKGRRKLHVCHLCDRRQCCRPDHLFLGNDHDNMQDAAKKGRLPRKMTPEKVYAIRTIYATGQFTQKAVGKMFGISQATVRQIVSRTTWQHVE